MIETTAGSVPVKLRITYVHLEGSRGAAQGILFLSKKVDGQITFPDNRKHTFSVNFREENSELVFTGVRITGRKHTDLLILEAVREQVAALIKSQLSVKKDE